MERLKQSVISEVKRLKGPLKPVGSKSLERWARKGLNTHYHDFFYLDFLLFIYKEQRELTSIKQSK
jgi:hypothetical protein